MLRRQLIGCALAAAMPTLGNAQVVDLNDAINKAGRQRMLSQRMAKAWFAIAHDVEANAARSALDRSMGLFDRQLVELKTYAPGAEVREVYDRLDTAWSEFKTVLVGSAPARERAAAVLTADARVLALAHQGTVLYEAASGKSIGKLVNIAGRQQMLSQRMAKFYLAATWQADAGAAIGEISKARAEFIAATETLRNAPQATARIREELQLADGQWVFFDNALRKPPAAASNRSLAEVFVTSENLLAVMDRITGLYAAATS